MALIVAINFTILHSPLVCRVERKKIWNHFVSHQTENNSSSSSGQVNIISMSLFDNWWVLVVKTIKNVIILPFHPDIVCNIFEAFSMLELYSGRFWLSWRWDAKSWVITTEGEGMQEMKGKSDTSCLQVQLSKLMACEFQSCCNFEGWKVKWKRETLLSSCVDRNFYSF